MQCLSIGDLKGLPCSHVQHESTQREIPSLSAPGILNPIWGTPLDGNCPSLASQNLNATSSQSRSVVWVQEPAPVLLSPQSVHYTPLAQIEKY